MAISPDGLIEAANIISALLFAAGHLPGTAAMTTLTPLLLFRCFLFNGGLGLGFGYLYEPPPPCGAEPRPEVQAGNFSSWWENKEKKDSFQQAENVRHLKEIGKLKAAADKSSRWADKNENSKIGFDPVKEHDRSIATRAFIGAKTKKMQARVKNYERRIYIWDEPLNYIDVFSRMQIENLILQYKPTMLLVEHDTRFQEKVASDIIKIGQAHYRDFV